MKLRLPIIFVFVATALVRFFRGEIRCRAIHGWNRVTGREFTVSDRPLPEGGYPSESLNPNRRFHLAPRVGCGQIRTGLAELLAQLEQ